jgi:hypothetical protein
LKTEIESYQYILDNQLFKFYENSNFNTAILIETAGYGVIDEIG